MWFTLTPAERARLHEQLRGVADDPRALDNILQNLIQFFCQFMLDINENLV